MDGKSFFYTNAMEIKNTFRHKDMEAERSGWFPCSCCPTNVTRLIPSIPGYVYALKDNDLYVNLFVNSTSSFSIKNKTIGIRQENNYPWEGNLKFTIDTSSPIDFRILVRIPGWAKETVVPSDLYKFNNAASKPVAIRVNGTPVNYASEKGYALLSKKWKKGDVIEVDLPMDVRTISANENIKDDIGKIALQRGPLMYCAEWPDNNGKVSNLILPVGSTFNATFEPDLLNGIVVVKSNAKAIAVDEKNNSVTTNAQDFKAIPYYAWAHRGKGEMIVWIPQQIKAIEIFSGNYPVSKSV
jgi:DUF1680 family protein